MKTSEKIDQIASALVDLQSEISNVKSSSTNPFYNSKYADLATIINEVRPLLAVHRLAVIQGASGEILTTRIIHDSGQWIESELNLSVPKWSNPQDVGKSMTYARRYELAAMLCVAQEDDDGNSLAKKTNKVEPITANQAYDLQTLITDTNTDLDKFLEYFKVENIADISTDDCPKAVEMLERKRT